MIGLSRDPNLVQIAKTDRTTTVRLVIRVIRTDLTDPHIGMTKTIGKHFLTTDPHIGMAKTIDKHLLTTDPLIGLRTLRGIMV